MLPIRLLCYAIPLSLLFATPAYSQTPAKKSIPSDARTPIDFGAGTIDSYVEILRATFSDANIVVDGVGTLSLPKAPLKSVNLAQALEWIPKTGIARKCDLLLQVARTGKDAVVVYVLTTSKDLPKGAPCTKPPEGSASTPPADQDHLGKTYCLETVAEGSPEERLKIISNGVAKTLEKSPDGELPTAKFDEKTGCLNVEGSRAQIARADQYVEELRRGQRLPSPSLPALQKAVEKLRSDFDVLKQQQQK